MIHKVIAKSAASDPFAIALSIVFVDLTSGCKIKAISNCCIAQASGSDTSTLPHLDRVFKHRASPRVAIETPGGGSLHGTAGHETVRPVDRSSAIRSVGPSHRD
jgi:hypothetical protein